MADFKARPTIYKGIQMRSRLEAGFAAWLDEHTLFEWEYEPCAFATESGQYLPDFKLSGVVFRGGIRTAYVEVKPPPHFVDGDSEDYDEHAWEAREGLWRQMAIVWESDPDAILFVAGPGHLDYIFTDSALSSPWAIECCVWTSYTAGVDGIALPAHPTHEPWAGEWWKPRRPA